MNINPKFDDANRMDEAQRAATARWDLLRLHMDDHPHVHWATIYRLIAELKTYRDTGQVHWKTEQEMEERGL